MNEKMKKKIWIPYKIWDETQWFINFENKINKIKIKKSK